MTVAEVVEFYKQVLDQDYVANLQVNPIGPKMKEVDAALAEQKQALVSSEVVFGTLADRHRQHAPQGRIQLQKQRNDDVAHPPRSDALLLLLEQAALEVLRRHSAQKKAIGAPSYMGATYKDAIGVLTKRFGVAGPRPRPKIRHTAQRHRGRLGRRQHPRAGHRSLVGEHRRARLPRARDRATHGGVQGRAAEDDGRHRSRRSPQSPRAGTRVIPTRPRPMLTPARPTRRRPASASGSPRPPARQKEVS